MTADYIENESSKKKYFAPLVVIMLCAVALTGAAYAYSTSVSGNGDIKGNYVVIDIYNSGEAVQTDIPLAAVSDTINITTDTDKTVTVEDNKYYVASLAKTKITFETYVKINTDLSGKTFTLSVKMGTYTPGEGAGSLTFSDEIMDLKIYNTGSSSDETSNPINGDTLYRVTFACYVVGGTTEEADTGIFGSYASLTDVSAAVAAIENCTLKITLAATESTSTS